MSQTELPSLSEALADIPDPRSRHGRRYPLAAILRMLALNAILGRKSVASATRLLDDYGPQLAIALGFPHYRLPGAPNLCTLLRRLDAAAIEQRIAQWTQERIRAMGLSCDLLHVDGKALRGSRDGEFPGTHLLAVYADNVRAVVAQMKVGADTNEHKALLQLLGLLPKDLRGKVITGDATFCQREVCKAIRDRGGHYLLKVKQNQPALVTQIDVGLTHQEIAATFSP